MRKILLLSILCIAVGINGFGRTSTTFSLQENVPLFVYSLPQTQLCIDVKIEKVTQQPGEFYKYSERFLATKEVITEEKTTYVLKDIQIKTKTIADPNRTYSIKVGKKTPIKNICVNEKGILYGINIPKDGIPREAEQAAPDKAPAPEQANTSKVLPLTEEYMIASSVAKMAEGAAKQIYRIRESRINLLTGDVDQLPADGESFKTMLDGMNQMEKELTELFTGKTIVESQTHTIYLTPSKKVNDEVLFRISSMKGLVAANDLSGNPYYISIVPKTIPMQPQTEKGTAGIDLYSILPTTAQVTISDGKSDFLSEEIIAPQFGRIIPIPEVLFQKNAEILIDNTTGRLLKTN